MKTKQIGMMAASILLAATTIFAGMTAFAQKPNHPLNGTQDTKPIPQTPESQNPSGRRLRRIRRANRSCRMHQFQGGKYSSERRR